MRRIVSHPQQRRNRVVGKSLGTWIIVFLSCWNLAMPYPTTPNPTEACPASATPDLTAPDPTAPSLSAPRPSSPNQTSPDLTVAHHESRHVIVHDLEASEGRTKVPHAYETACLLDHFV